MNEQAILEGCLREDKSTQEIFFKTYAPNIKAICMRYCKDEAEAEDAMIETFVKAFDNLKKFRNESSLKTWLRSIAVNHCINKIKKNKKHLFDDIETKNEKLLPVAENDAYQDMTQQEMMECLLKLPQGYRTVFNMYVIEGYKHEEIAKALNIEVVTSRSQLQRARLKLQEILNEHYSTKIAS